MGQVLQPLAQMPAEVRRSIRGVFADIDDTITSDGHLSAQAYGALERLRAAGLLVVPVTGRPAGWCDHIARMWPVDAVVGENGAFWFWHDRAAGKLRQRFVQDEAERAEGRRRLEAVRERVAREVPGAGVASDQFARIADLAIDFCEDVPALPAADIDRIVRIFVDAGAVAKVSSIHVNGWFGAYDKLTTTCTMMAELFGVDLGTGKDAYVFAGDSPNDAPMFGFFPNAVGVANVRDLAARMDSLPRWITAARSGEGFAELAEALLEGR
jgi:HAD superfamily hydrolase (TIGR01484 family)